MRRCIINDTIINGHLSWKLEIILPYNFATKLATVAVKDSMLLFIKKYNWGSRTSLLTTIIYWQSELILAVKLPYCKDIGRYNGYPFSLHWLLWKQSRAFLQLNTFYDTRRIMFQKSVLQLYLKWLVNHLGFLRSSVDES